MVQFTDLRGPRGTPDHYWLGITLRAEQLESVNLCSTSHVCGCPAARMFFCMAARPREADS